MRREGPPSEPRPSACVIVLRDGASAPQLLLVQRSAQQKFMGGFWVFPGGAVDEGESHRVAAVRELAEEAAIDDVAPDELVLYSRWITPEAIAIRFDTHFFLARAPDGARPRVDGRECVDLRWATAREALDAHARGELALVFPTIKQLQGLATFSGVDELLEHARGLDVRPVLPRVLGSGDQTRVLLPGEPGYEDRETA